MPASPVALVGAGLVTALGLTGEESCAAIRCGINNFAETRFINSSGTWLIGSAVTLPQPWRGITKLAKMAAAAIAECCKSVPGVGPSTVPLLMCIAEPERPGRFDALPQVILEAIERELQARLHPHSKVIDMGRVGGAVACLQARQMLAEASCSHVIVAGVDSYLNGATLAHFDRESRLLQPDNSNGFIPGEAAAAVLLTGVQDGTDAALLLRGLGFAREPAPLGSGKPLRAEGLVQAIKAALADAAMELKQCGHRIADVSGEQYRFKEAALAVQRLLRDRKVAFSLWHPADCIGETGAAALFAMLAVLLAGAQRDYLPARTFLGHLGNDDDKRAAFIVQSTVPQTLALEAAALDAFGQKRRSAA